MWMDELSAGFLARFSRHHCRHHRVVIITVISSSPPPHLSCIEPTVITNSLILWRAQIFSCSRSSKVSKQSRWVLRFYTCFLNWFSSSVNWSIGPFLKAQGSRTHRGRWPPPGELQGCLGNTVLFTNSSAAASIKELLSPSSGNTYRSRIGKQATDHTFFVHALTNKYVKEVPAREGCSSALET